MPEQEDEAKVFNMLVLLKLLLALRRFCYQLVNIVARSFV
jgi:hypothetical protein